jgi:chemotaxis protein MotB
VEGHTDNKPIKTVAFYSNWELSAARAGSVVRVLQAHGVSPDRLAVIGYGDQRPVRSNDTEQGRNANRRVVVVILSTELQRLKDPAGDPQLAAPVAPSTPAPVAPATTAALQPNAVASPGQPADLPTAHPAALPTVTPTTPAAAHVSGGGIVPAP